MSSEKPKGYHPEITKPRTSDEERAINYYPKDKAQSGYFPKESELPEITHLEPLDEDLDPEIDAEDDEETVKTDRGIRVGQNVAPNRESTDPGKRTIASIGTVEGGHGEEDVESLGTKMEAVNADERNAKTIAAAILKIETKLSAGYDGNTLLEQLFAEIDANNEAIEAAQEDAHGQKTVVTELELQRTLLQAQIDWLEAHLNLDKDAA